MAVSRAFWNGFALFGLGVVLIGLWAGVLKGWEPGQAPAQTQEQAAH